MCSDKSKLHHMQSDCWSFFFFLFVSLIHFLQWAVPKCTTEHFRNSYTSLFISIWWDFLCVETTVIGSGVTGWNKIIRYYVHSTILYTLWCHTCASKFEYLGFQVKYKITRYMSEILQSHLSIRLSHVMPWLHQLCHFSLGREWLFS